MKVFIIILTYFRARGIDGDRGGAFMGRLFKIATLAGVSQSTVSRVLNQPDLVSREKRERVFKAMQDIGFQPKKKAADQATYMIGLAIPDMSIDINWEWIKSIESELDPTPYSLALFHTRRRTGLAAYFKQHPNFRRKIDALVILSSELDREVTDLFRSLNLPVVLIQNRSDIEKSIITNNYLGASDATQYLISRGYRRIGFIGWEPKDTRCNDRFLGYTASLNKAGITVEQKLIAHAALSRKGGYEATRELLGRTDVEAIFYACDSMALGGCQYCRDHRVMVPDDLGIMGFDDLEMAEAVGLTTMHQFIPLKANMAVDYLLQRLAMPDTEYGVEEHSITPKLVVRQTTR